MHYYIDGYNLLFRLLRASDDLQAQRESIIEELGKKIQFVGLDATIVFDAQYQVGESTKSHFNDMAILFTAQGDTADEYIINELKCVSDARQETVVTSDKKLAWRARRKAAHSESVEEFVEWLNRRYKNKIRNLKQEKQRLQAPTPLAAPAVAPPRPSTPPSQKDRPEQCLEYYAQVFEKQYAEMANSVPAKAEKRAEQDPSKRKKKPKVEKPEEDTRTDMERWEDIFEKRSKASSDNF